jgi:hypothetical protein
VEEIKYKQCYSCKQDHPTNQFYKNSNKKDGLDPYCKPCRNHRKLNPITKDELPNGRALRMDDFYLPEKKWKKLETWNKFDATRFDELLYNGGDITEVFFVGVHERNEWEKSRKKKRRWGK